MNHIYNPSDVQYLVLHLNYSYHRAGSVLFEWFYLGCQLYCSGCKCTLVLMINRSFCDVISIVGGVNPIMGCVNAAAWGPEVVVCGSV